jgi:hypothetical protein
VALLTRRFRAFSIVLIFGLVLRSTFAAQAPTEEQVKAVFVFNFTHFVEWPGKTFSSPAEPFIIGVLGNDSFAARLSEVIEGEKIEQHPLAVRRFRSVAELGECAVLFIDKTQAPEISALLGTLNHRGTLTVTDADVGAERGVMIQFATENNRIRLRINVEAARLAALTISSKLLRPAEIVTGSGN